MVDLMPGEISDLRIAIGGLQADLKNLAKKFDDHQESTEREQRTVHDIVVATNEAIRNLTRVVDEMKPLTDDYREKRAEARGAARLVGVMYVALGSSVALAASKLWDTLSARPHP